MIGNNRNFHSDFHSDVAEEDVRNQNYERKTCQYSLFL